MNFSVLPAGLLHRLVVVSEPWNHYAAAGFQAKRQLVMIPTTERETPGWPVEHELHLIVHGLSGLSAISVYSETIGVRALAAALTLLVLSGLGSP